MLGTMEVRFPETALEVGRGRVFDRPMLEGRALEAGTLDLALAFGSG